MARFIYYEVYTGLQAKENVRIASVKLWETDTCSATYRPPTTKPLTTK